MDTGHETAISPVFLIQIFASPIYIEVYPLLGE